MAMTTDQLVNEVLALPSDKRADFVDRIVESLDFSDSEIRDAWIKEAKRRHEELASGKVKGIPGDEALASVRKAVGR